MTTTLEPGATERVAWLPQQWLRGLLGGIEAALLGWLLVVVPAVAAYVATAAAPLLGEADWTDAAAFATALWLVGHGGTLHVGEVALTLMPLGQALLSGALVYGATRRARIADWRPACYTVAGFVAATLGLSAVAPGPAGRWRVLGIALLIAIAATALALRRAGAPPPGILVAGLNHVPPYVRRGIRDAMRGMLILAVAATALALIALLRGVVTVVELHEALDPGAVGAAALILLQLLYLPTAIVWALAWLAGPGFAVGTGTVFSPAEVVTAPLPAIPMLGALPEPGQPGLSWVMVLGVVVGAYLGWTQHRRGPRGSWWQALVTGLVTAIGAGVLVATLSRLAHGGIGPGRMAELGPAPLAVGLAIAAQLAIGCVIVVLATHADVRRGVRHGYQRLKELIARRRPSPAPDA
ncbi:MAG TPA: DUF6350 family protein [Actinomycetaceae bacterium]|nr:DUF6350 family protein [Actinomycetaceae bacterium]